MTDDKALEAAIKAFYKEEAITENMTDGVKAAIRAYHEWLEANGLAIVPVEPTERMLEAARRAAIPMVYLDSLTARQDLEIGARYRAMIAAAKG